MKPTRNYKFYIYIISNPVFKGWYKVGRSIDPLKRLESYQVGDPNRGYKIEFSMIVKNPNIQENKIYSMSDCSGEWIKSDLNELISVIKLIEEKQN